MCVLCRLRQPRKELCSLLGADGTKDGRRPIMQSLCCDSVALFQHSSHSFGHSEVLGGDTREDVLVQRRDFDKGVTGSKLEREDGVAKIMPINDKFCIPEEAYECGNGECWYRGWILLLISAVLTLAGSHHSLAPTCISQAQIDSLEPSRGSMLVQVLSMGQGPGREACCWI